MALREPTPAREPKRRCGRGGPSASVPVIPGRWDVSVRADFWGRAAPSGGKAALRFDEGPIRAKSTRSESEGAALLDEDDDCEATNKLRVRGRQILVSHKAH